MRLNFGGGAELNPPAEGKGPGGCIKSAEGLGSIYGGCKPALMAVKSLNVTKVIMNLPHLDTRLQKLRELVLRELVSFKHVPGEDNPADLFTKLVTKAVWDRLLPLLLNTEDDYGFIGRVKCT